MSALKQADDAVQVEAARYESIVQRLANDARKALGFSTRQALSGRGRASKFLDATHAWETGGEAGLRQYVAALGRSAKDADVVVQSYRQLDDLMLDMNRVLQGSTVGRAPIELDGSLGVQRYIPHLSEGVDSATLFDDMARAQG